MNRFVKLLLASALLACTVTASACSGGAERGESQKTPCSPETAAPVKTDAANATPAESTEPPAVSEVPSGAEKWINACGDANSSDERIDPREVHGAHGHRFLSGKHVEKRADRFD